MKNQKIEDRWLCPEEAREYLGLPSREALYAMKSRGELPYYMLGRRLRFKCSELDALIEAGRHRVVKDATKELVKRQKS